MRGQDLGFGIQGNLLANANTLTSDTRPLTPFDDALKYLDYLCTFGVKAGLERITAMTDALGKPQNFYRTIHVAGTNGKGSTCAMLAEILQTAGLKVGLFTSPHLESYCERIKVDGENISETDFAEEIFCVKNCNVDGTHFEVLTAAAFDYFKRRGVDVAVIEVGLGGTWDSTNIITPDISVITNVARDHENILGDLDSIARNKAGIIKPHVPCVTGAVGRPLEIIRTVAAEKNSPLHVVTKPFDGEVNLRGDFRLKWEIDSCNTLEFRPNFSLNFSKSTNVEGSGTWAGDAARTPVNSSQSSYSNDGKSYEFGGQFVFNHKFASHPGRSTSIMVRYNYSKVTEDGNTYTLNRYYLTDSTQTIDQIYDNDRKTNSVNGRLSWTEPLGNVKNARFLEAAYNARYRYALADKMVYDITRGTTQAAPLNLQEVIYSPALRSKIAADYGDYVLNDGQLLSQILDLELGPELRRDFNERLSNSFRNKFFDQSFQLGFRQVRKQYNLNLGLTVNSAMSSSRDLINSARDIPSRWVWSVAPYARFRYKFSKTRTFNANYRMRANQPSITQLQPVADESNPLNIVVGNPELKPTFVHNLNLRFQDFATMAQRSIMAMANISFEQNSIISTTTYDATTGGRTTSYTNVGGVWSAMAMNMMSFPFGASKTWYFSSHLFARYSATKGYNNGEINRSGSFNINYSPGLAFRNGVFDLELRPRYNFQTTHNTVQTTNDRNVHTYGGQFNGTYSAPFGLVISTDLSYSATSGYSAGYDTKQWLWNGSIAYQFLRDKSAAVTLSVYDILGQRKSIYRNVTGNYIEDVAYNSLTRYGMITLTYRFTTFKKGQQPKAKGDDDWGPGRGPGGPGGPGRPGGWGGGRRPF